MESSIHPPSSSSPHFDVLILSTSLSNSIAAAALAQHGYSVAHVDPNPYYGGTEASLSLPEFLALRGESPDRQVPQARQYTISLSPSVIPATGPLIEALVGSGVARYGGFSLVQDVGIWEAGIIHTVPGSKEDIFTSRDLSLLDKRRLMRFLMWVSSGQELQDATTETTITAFLTASFSLTPKLTSYIAHALAYCFRPTDLALPAINSIRNWMKGVGRYGKGPFLIAQYGSSGELAQGFARAAAVAGGIYVLGRTVSNVEYIASTTNIEPTRGEEELKGGDAYYKLTLSGNDDKEPPLELTCKVLVAARGDLPRPLELGGRVRELTLEGEGVEYGDAYTYAAWPLARAVAIVGKRVKFGATASTRTDSTTGETGEDGAADEGPEEDGEQVGHTAAIVVFPPRCFGEHEQSEGGKESPSVQGRGETGTGTLPETSQGTSLPPLPDVAVTALITGAGTGCVPAPSRAGGKKWIVYLSAPLSPESLVVPRGGGAGENEGTSVVKALLRPYLRALLGIPLGEEDEDAVLSESYYVEWPGDSARTTAKEEETAERLPPPLPASVRSKGALLIPASLPAVLPLPVHPDLAARVAEGVWKGVVECLGRPRGDAQAEVGSGDVLGNEEEGELSFWPPREDGGEEEED